MLSLMIQFKLVTNPYFYYLAVPFVKDQPRPQTFARALAYSYYISVTQAERLSLGFLYFSTQNTSTLFKGVSV